MSGCQGRESCEVQCCMDDRPAPVAERLAGRVQVSVPPGDLVSLGSPLVPHTPARPSPLTEQPGEREALREAVDDVLCQRLPDSMLPEERAALLDALLSVPLAPLLTDLADARSRAKAAEGVLRLLDQLAEDTDDVPCRYDHHGACQEHGGGSEEPGECSDRDAHELLKRLGVRRALRGTEG